jgi:hypothetical protein
MRVFLLGAGASKAYDQSPTGLRMPIARDFFETYDKTLLASDPWALIEGLISYLEGWAKVGSAYDYLRSGIDIEALHSGIEAARNEAMKTGEYINWMVPYRAYNELVFLFTSVINEIQNGPVSKPHLKLVEAMEPGDAVVTFNWDTLMDRALAESTAWRPDWGYGCLPLKIFRDGWSEPERPSYASSTASLIKLHGSTNWLTAHPVTDGKQTIHSSHDLPSNAFAIYEHATQPFACFAGRYRGGFEPFSYGYYPPNLDFPGRAAPEGYLIVGVRPRVPWRKEGAADDSGLPSIPLIIPPVQNKSYEFFGDLFASLWAAAENALVAADEIVVIGYSFPVTDIQSDALFRKAFTRRSTMPKISILDPAPERVAAKFSRDFGITRDHLRVEKDYFSADYDLDRLL